MYVPNGDGKNKFIELGIITFKFIILSTAGIFCDRTLCPFYNFVVVIPNYQFQDLVSFFIATILTINKHKIRIKFRLRQFDSICQYPGEL